MDTKNMGLIAALVAALLLPVPVVAQEPPKPCRAGGAHDQWTAAWHLDTWRGDAWRTITEDGKSALFASWAEWTGDGVANEDGTRFRILSTNPFLGVSMYVHKDVPGDPMWLTRMGGECAFHGYDDEVGIHVMFLRRDVYRMMFTPSMNPLLPASAVAQQMRYGHVDQHTWPAELQQQLTDSMLAGTPGLCALGTIEDGNIRIKALAATSMPDDCPLPQTVGLVFFAPSAPPSQEILIEVLNHKLMLHPSAAAVFVFWPSEADGDPCVVDTPRRWCGPNGQHMDRHRKPLVPGVDA